jgi:AcrR family transcriptional regulator
MPVRLDDAIDGVRDGLFFRIPPPLPRGRHSLASEQILDAQRERLMIAATELLAARGYDSIRIGDLADRASISRQAFYRCYPDKQACVLAAYTRFIHTLLTRLVSALDPSRPIAQFVETAVRGYLEPLQQDLVVARAFQVEIDAMGPVARRIRRESLQLFADTLARHHHQLAADDPELEPLPSSAYLGIVYAVRQLASDTLDTDRTPDLLALIPELTTWTTKLLL